MTPADPTTNGRLLIDKQPLPTVAVTFYDPTGQPSIVVSLDGKVWLAPGVTPDEASRAFWDAVERIGGERLERARRGRNK